MLVCVCVCVCVRVCVCACVREREREKEGLKYIESTGTDIEGAISATHCMK